MVFLHPGSDMTSMKSATFEQQLLEREAARGRALVARDFTSLESLLADDLIYVHSTGVVQDKAVYLDYVQGPLTFLSVERRNLTVTILDNAAIMTGYMSNVIRPPGPAAAVTVDSHVVQVWTLGAAGWQISLFQATRLPTT